MTSVFARGDHIDRPRLFAFAGILSAGNALSSPILSAIRDHGPGFAALDLFGVSGVVIFALFVLERISADCGDAEPLQRFDGLAVALLFLASFLPIVMLSGLALIGLSLWLGFTSSGDSRSRRLAVLLLALTGPLVWGKVALILFGQQVLALDAQLVGLISGSSVTGNIVTFSGERRGFYIAAACSSINHLTLATVLWAAITQMLGIRVTPRSLLLCLAAIAGVIVVNTVRLTAIALYPADFATLHDGWLAGAFGWLALLIAGLIIAAGVNRAARV